MINTALDALVAVQSGLTITSPASLAVTKAYKYLPPPNFDIGRRVWQNEWTMPELDWRTAIFHYTVRMQFIVGPASDDFVNLHDIATAFFEALTRAIYPVGVTADQFRLAQSLGGACLNSVLRGADPTVGLIARGGNAYVGAEGFLDLYYNDYMAVT